ncbi:MAG: hypothetical protein IPM16_04860 [Chloroflexi bacterium]|nr:hypothetical protein [Chloroflexota bacterium]
MRNFHPLDVYTDDQTSGLLTFSSSIDAPFRPQLSMRKEGTYVSLAISHGPIELALRPRIDELRRVLGRLVAVEGLQTTRQVGTGEAYIALGLQGDGTLLMRPTLVADATGHLCFNLLLTPASRTVLYTWFGVISDDE